MNSVTQSAATSTPKKWVSFTTFFSKQGDLYESGGVYNRCPEEPFGFGRAFRPGERVEECEHCCQSFVSTDNGDAFFWRSTHANHPKFCSKSKDEPRELDASGQVAITAEIRARVAQSHAWLAFVALQDAGWHDLADRLFHIHAAAVHRVSALEDRPF